MVLFLQKFVVFESLFDISLRVIYCSDYDSPLSLTSPNIFRQQRDPVVEFLFVFPTYLCSTYSCTTPFSLSFPL